jgi:hypothetical protein
MTMNHRIAKFTSDSAARALPEPVSSHSAQAPDIVAGRADAGPCVTERANRTPRPVRVDDHQVGAGEPMLAVPND